MGRHSAPDEPDSDGRPDDGVAVRTGPAYRPRRARPDTDDEPTGPADDTDRSGPGTTPREHRPLERRQPERRRTAPARESDETARIERVVDAEIDAPVPEAVTERFEAVRDVDDDVDDDLDDDLDHHVDDDLVGDPVSGPAPAPARTAGETDLELLRGDSAVRARVIAAVLLPFVLYVGVLIGIGAMTERTFLIWIWVPLVSAGVLAGLILDAAHRRRPSAVVSARDDRVPDETVRDDDSGYDESGYDDSGYDDGGYHYEYRYDDPGPRGR